MLRKIFPNKPMLNLNFLDSVLVNPAISKPGSPDNIHINCIIYDFISRCIMNGKYLDEI